MKESKTQKVGTGMFAINQKDLCVCGTSNDFYDLPYPFCLFNAQSGKYIFLVQA